MHNALEIHALLRAELEKKLLATGGGGKMSI